jgi:hypothetical protein
MKAVEGAGEAALETVFGSDAIEVEFLSSVLWNLGIKAVQGGDGESSEPFLHHCAKVRHVVVVVVVAGDVVVVVVVVVLVVDSVVIVVVVVVVVIIVVVCVLVLVVGCYRSCI